MMIHRMCLKIKKSKKSKWLLSFLLLGFVIFTSLAWYNGFIPVASGRTKADLRHALNLTFLPSTVKINVSGSESWTDYLFEVDLSIDPEELDTLLKGREFQEQKPFGKHRVTSAYRIVSYSGFKIDRTLEWEYEDEASCIVYVNKSRDRVFIRFMAD